LLTRTEKEERIIYLYKQDKTIREIAKEVHMSFRDISSIIKREFGTKEEEHVSIDSQVLKLFSKGLKPLDVIFKLNMKADEVKKLYTEYQSLSGLERINTMYKELGENIEPFFKLYKIMKEQGLSPEEIAKAARAGNDLPILELKYEGLKEQARKIQDKKQNLISEKENLESAIGVSRTVIANLDEGIQKRMNEIKSLDRKQRKLRDSILNLMHSKEYKKVKEIAHKEARTILNDKKALLTVTLVAVLQAFKLNPERLIFISTFSSDENNQSYFSEQHKNELLELAEKIRDELTTQLVNTVMNSV